MSFRNCGSSEQLDKDGEGEKVECYLLIDAAPSNEPLHVTAARVRFWMNVNSLGGAAARERRR
jgi:hypothetical protein